MAAGDSSDLLMYFKRKGKAIRAESTTTLRLPGFDNKLTAGFEPQHIFEIDSFTFSVGIEDEPDAAAQKAAQERLKRGEPPPKRASTSGQFARWRGGSSAKYPVSMQPVQITRLIDRASSELLQSCIDSDSFDEVALIKRKAAGGPSAGKVYMRFDFKGVLIKQIEWTSDADVKESCSFISRSVTVNYRPQLNDGSLGAVMQGFWSMLPWEKPVMS